MQLITRIIVNYAGHFCRTVTSRFGQVSWCSAAILWISLAFIYFSEQWVEFLHIFTDSNKVLSKSTSSGTQEWSVRNFGFTRARAHARTPFDITVSTLCSERLQCKSQILCSDLLLVHVLQSRCVVTGRLQICIWDVRVSIRCRHWPCSPLLIQRPTYNYWLSLSLSNHISCPSSKLISL